MLGRVCQGSEKELSFEISCKKAFRSNFFEGGVFVSVHASYMIENQKETPQNKTQINPHGKRHNHSRI